MTRTVWSWGSAAVLASAVVASGAVITAAGGQAAAQKKAGTKAGATKAVPPEVAFSVAGIRLVGSPVGETEYGELTAFNASTGIQVALAVRVPAGYTIVDSDDDESVVTRLVDDQGTDLAAETSFDFSPDYSKDRTVLVTTITASGVLAAEARAVTVAGTLHVQTARGERASKVTKVALTPGQAFKVDGAAYMVRAVEVDGDQQSVTITTTRAELTAVKDMRFLDPAGAAIEADRTMTGYMNDIAEVMYSLPAAVKTATIEVVRYENLETQRAPFSFTLGLGSIR